jgi:tetratricopeptide (TPR) repeat protein
MKAMALAPQTAIFPVTLADLVDESQRFAADRDENLRRLLLNRALQMAPENPAALTALANYYLRSLGSPQQAQEYITRALRQNPLAVGANLTQIDIYVAHGWLPQALRTCEEVSKRHRGFAAVAEKHAEVAMANERFPLALEMVLKRRHSDRVNFLLTTVAARLHEDRDDGAAATAVWRDYLTLRPNDLSARLKLLELLARLPDTADAIEELIAATLTLAPGCAPLLAQRGQLRLRQNRADDAKLDFAAALQLEPTLTTAREFLIYEGQEIPELLPPILDLAEFVATQEAALDTLDGAALHATGDRLLYRTEQIDELHRDGTKRRGSRSIYKILTPTGVEKSRRHGVWFDPDTEQVTFIAARALQNGETISEAQIMTAPQRSSESGMAVLGAIFPSLNVGDVVEVAYVVEQLQPDFFGDYFGFITRFRKPEFAQISRYTLRTPPDKKVFFHQVGAPVAQETVNETQHEWTWEMQNLPPFPEESFAPPANDLSPRVEISTFASWNDLAIWYWGLIKEQNVPTPEIVEKVKELAPDTATPREKITAIYTWVAKEIRNNEWAFGVHGFKPYSAGAIFTRRFGDCKDQATLINVMAKVAGLTAYPLLLRACDQNEGRGHEDLTLPLLAHFNHCISVLEIAGEKVFADGTMNYHTLDNLPFTIVGAAAVIVRPDGAEVTVTPPPTPEDHTWHEQGFLQVDEKGTADYAFVTRGRGQTAVLLRAWFRNEKTWDEVLKALGGERYGKISAATVNDIVDQTSAEAEAALVPDEMRFDARLRLRDYAPRQNHTAEVVIPAPLLAGKFFADGAVPRHLFDYARFSRRDSAVVLPALFTVTRVLKVEYPETWALVGLPEPVTLSHPFGELAVHFTRNGNTLEINYTLKMKQTTVAPEAYAAFRNFCLVADRLSELRLRFDVE